MLTCFGCGAALQSSGKDWVCPRRSYQHEHQTPATKATLYADKRTTTQENQRRKQ